MVAERSREPIGLAQRRGRSRTGEEPAPLPGRTVSFAPPRDAGDRVGRPVAVPRGLRSARAGRPLSVRERGRRSRLERMLGGSALLHVLFLGALALLFARQKPPPPPEDQAPVDVVYGQSGLTGEPAPTPPAAGAKPEPQQPPPTPPAPEPQPQPTPPPQQEPTVNTELPLQPPPVPIPDLTDLPPPPPLPPVPERPQARSEPTRIPLQNAPRAARSSRNPFANPMDLSFGSAPGPTISRRGRPSGSAAPIDMSIGPLVKNGHLNTPYATVGVKGVSSDYEGLLNSWIRRHIYYPPDAARRGEDGSTHVYVVIDRSGHVKSLRLLDSSGSQELDDAFTGIFRGAKLPDVPPDMAGDAFPLDLTLNYVLIR